MKNIRYFLLATLVFVATATLFAENESSKASGPTTLSVLGTVIDKITNETLPGVTIQMTDTDTKIYSNPDGTFSLDGLQPGQYEVKVSCISYKDKVVSLDVQRSVQNTLSVQLESVEP
ncbi:MAG: carboxypeptidase-like regulatory domain-containing protein [Bacteroidales bacterium]|nr:carboxypeptidase-like regulatory domain-containing protein [Bacteroidales bacterium]